MAKVFALQRSAGQTVTLDTVTISSENLGSTIPGVQTTSVFPARCVNLYTVFQGNPYFLSLSAIGDIEVHRLISGTWSLVGGPYTPAVGHVYTPQSLHVVNDQIVAIWSDEAGAGDGIVATTSFDGTTWAALDVAAAAIGASSGGASIVYRGAIWFTTAIGLWAYAPLARFITVGGIVGSYTVGETVTGSGSGTTAVVRSVNPPLLRVDTVVGTGFTGGDTITGLSSGATSTFVSKTRFVNTAPDTGSDGDLGTGSANLIGSFASWDGTLHFVRPQTAFVSTKFYTLNNAWGAALGAAAPQWTIEPFSGIVAVGPATVAADSGPWALFVNRNDELCLFYSASGSTKLAKTALKTTPLVFTDLSNTLLPTNISTKTNLGITLYTDDRRRDNLLQSFMIRDLSGGTTIIAGWDGTGSVVEKGSIPGVDYLLPSSRLGQEATFTNLQPTIHITSVSEPFPGRLRIDYVVKADPSRTVGIIPEYSIDGDQYFPMTAGSDDSGTTDLPASPGGDPYFFNWDTFADLDGSYSDIPIRIVDRISGV